MKMVMPILQKKENLKPDIDIVFIDFNEAHFYLRSVS